MVGTVSWAIYRGVSTFLSIISTLILVYCILSWITRPDSPIFRFVSRIVQPFIEPFRPIGRKLYDLGFRFDLSPWLAMVALRVLNEVIYWILFRLL